MIAITGNRGSPRQRNRRTSNNSLPASRARSATGTGKTRPLTTSSGVRPPTALCGRCALYQRRYESTRRRTLHGRRASHPQANEFGLHACREGGGGQMDAGAVLEGPEGVGQGGEVQACGEADEAAGHVLDVPFDGGGGLGLDAADEGGGIAQRIGDSLGAPGSIGGSQGVNP